MPKTQFVNLAGLPWFAVPLYQPMGDRVLNNTVMKEILAGSHPVRPIHEDRFFEEAGLEREEIKAVEPTIIWNRTVH